MFGELHARTLAGLAEAELVAVCARRQASIDSFNARGLAVPGWTDLDRAVAESGAEAWIVAASTQAHVPITRTLLEAEKSVLLEKPVAPTLEEAKSLAELVTRHRGVLMLGHILLFNSEFRHLMTEVEARGRPRFVSAVRHRPVELQDDLTSSPFNLVMVHDLYCVQMLVDRAEPTAFSAQLRRPAHGELADLGLAQLRWGGHTVASLTASFMAPQGMGEHGYDRLEVFGDGWAARLDPNPRPFALWDDATRYPMNLEIQPDPIRPTGMMAEEQRSFCRAVRGIEAVPAGATYNDAIQVQSWIHQLEVASGFH
jgi:predicted dehydrogenase